MNRYWLILRRFLISLVIVVVTAYAGIVGYLYVAQRSLLYSIHPEPN